MVQQIPDISVLSIRNVSFQSIEGDDQGIGREQWRLVTSIGSYCKPRDKKGSNVDTVGRRSEKNKYIHHDRHYESLADTHWRSSVPS